MAFLASLTLKVKKDWTHWNMDRMPILKPHSWKNLNISWNKIHHTERFSCQVTYRRMFYFPFLAPTSHIWYWKTTGKQQTNFLISSLQTLLYQDKYRPVYAIWRQSIVLVVFYEKGLWNLLVVFYEKGLWNLQLCHFNIGITERFKSIEHNLQ